MRVLVVGGGGREHALVWALSKSPSIERIYAAPGNPGIGELARCVPISSSDVGGLADFAEREAVDLTVVGPEAPLVAGLANEMQARGLPVFGPTRDAALIEGSKAYARKLCMRHGIPGAKAQDFADPAKAKEFLDQLEAPYVVKADGLAGGKGVIIAEDRAQAERAIDDCLINGAFGDAGRRIVIEEHLVGQEVSALALTDGEHVLPLAASQDHKRAEDGDRGPNTGGMGAYSPVPAVDDATWSVIVQDVLKATVTALRAEGTVYRGVLYAGIMLTADGPRVLEFNCRFGDPETQALLPRIRSDLHQVLRGCTDGTLAQREIEWDDRPCVSVVVVSEGYPGPSPTGREITGLEEASGLPDTFVFHAGTARKDGRVTTAGGRVLNVSALGADLAEARARAYEGVSRIRFEGMRFRRDIGERAT
ncbi:MAG: phosphoribosylamine--glycine ligase [Actinobacteria bacterium]|nr:phosphoribosylamine--glycine ligase [Actinomycetota bacterium]